MMAGVLPDVVQQRVDEFLRMLDEVLPGQVSGFYLVGSIALGAFRPGRSDIDFIALMEGELDGAGVRRLARRLQHTHLLRAWADIGRGRWPLQCNGVYLHEEDLAISPDRVAPLASHVTHKVEVGAGFAANPVMWRELQLGGIALRGPEVERLKIHYDDRELRDWTLANMNDYWAGWARAIRSSATSRRRASVIRQAGVPWAVLGVPRLHHTVRTGQIISKEQAGEYSLDVFDAEWHPLINHALAYWRGTSSPVGLPDRDSQHRLARAADFVDMVIDDANPQTPEARGSEPVVFGNE